MSVWFYEPFYDLERVFDEALSSRDTGGQVQRRGENQNAVKVFKPRMDLHEDNEKNIVTASFEFPGVPKDKVDINVQNGRLTVSAESEQSSEHEEGGYAVRERRYGKFSRTLQLPQGESDIKAQLDNGILTVTFPKSTPELSPKKITIN
ncbi:HSP20-like chaperone [Flammula alnicola]|nr:HSP20-like chaperone [Flammula alnicola]